MVAKKLISKYSCNVPVLFIVFNRPSTTLKVFEKIREAKPKKLYVAADGPRNNVLGEDDVCDEVRRIATNVDWPCKVYTLFRKKNLGCGKAVSGAITWFFKKEKMGIILEDDCLPDKSFFNFCGELLIKYKDDESIMHISGYNVLEKVDYTYSYYFSRYVTVWGWATWRRAWKGYNLFVKDWKSGLGVSEFFSLSKVEQSYLLKCYDLAFSKKIDTWDYQWQYNCMINNGFGIVPKVNLVKNIGFGSGAIRTNNVNDWKANLNIFNLSCLKHPLKIVRNKLFEDLFVRKVMHQRIYQRLWEFFVNILTRVN